MSVRLNFYPMSISVAIAIVTSVHETNLKGLTRRINHRPPIWATKIILEPWAALNPGITADSIHCNMRSSVNVPSNVYILLHDSFDSDWTLQLCITWPCLNMLANLLSSTMLFSSCAILSNATFGGFVLLFAIGSFKKQKKAKKQTNRQMQWGF